MMWQEARRKGWEVTSRGNFQLECTLDGTAFLKWHTNEKHLLDEDLLGEE
jgi:hypothetical protein